MAKLRGLNLSLAAIMAEGVLSRFSFGAINLALPLYARHLGLSLTEVAILLSVNTAVALSLKPLCGRAIDHFGKKRSFTASLCLRSLVPLLFSISGTPLMLYGTAGVHGVSKSVRDPSVDSLIVENSKRNTVGSAFAWYSTAKTVSGSLGRGAAGIFLTLTASNFFLVFVLAALISASSLAAVLRFVREEKSVADAGAQKTVDVVPDPTNQTVTAVSPSERPGLLMTVLPFIGFGCFISGVGHMLGVLFPIFAVEYAGMSEAEVGIVFMAATAVVLLAGPGWGWLSDHFSRSFVLLSTSISDALASVIYLVFPVPLGIAAGKILDDAGKAAFRPSWGALMGAVSTLDPRRRGQAVGYMGMGKDAGEMAGPLIASVIWTMWGVPVLMGVRIALAIAAEVYTLMMLRKIQKLETRGLVLEDTSTYHEAAPAKARSAGEL